MTPITPPAPGWGLGPADERRVLRRSRTVRLSGFAVVAASVALLAFADGAALWPATALMAAGAGIATMGAVRLARLEVQRDPRTRRAVAQLVAAFALKAFAIPPIALGGAWFAWERGLPLPAAIAALALGFGAYVAGLMMRVHGLSRLPHGAHHG